MRTIILSLVQYLALSFPIGSLAQNCQIEVFTEQNETFFLFVNNVQQNQEARSNVIVSSLHPGPYQIRAVFEDPKKAQISQILYTTQTNGKMVYQIRLSRKGGYVFKLFSVCEEETSGALSNTAIDKSVVPSVYDYVEESYPSDLQKPFKALGCIKAMHTSHFLMAKDAIEKRSFESDKLTTARQLAGSNCLSAAQVKEIMELFAFESSKLEFAKLAYFKVVDTNNCFLIYKAFSFSSSVEELETFIKESSGN